MTIWAIVPVKPLRRSKSRLSEVMDSEGRAELSRKMLIHTLKVLDGIPEVEHALVISKDSQALAIAREQGARTVTERGSPTLNRALIRATVVASQYGVSGVLVLPADLPLLSEEDVLKMLAYAHDPPVVALAPDRRREGTNALLSAPPGLIEYDFGPGSFDRHLKHAQASGARVEICHLAGLELDLDVPDDLALLQEQLSHIDEPQDET